LADSRYVKLERKTPFIECLKSFLRYHKGGAFEVAKFRFTERLFWQRTLLVIILLILTLSAACGGGASTLPEGENVLIFSFDTWSGSYLPIYVLKSIFEDNLGYRVGIVELSVPDSYEQVALGGVHIYTDGWFPTQDSTFDKYPNLVKLGQSYGGRVKDAYEGWLVPTNFAIGNSLTHVEDLRRPGIASALDTDGNGKGNLVGAPKTWLASKRNDEILADFGLAGLYEQESGSEKELMEAIEKKLRQGKPTLFYLCLPNSYPTKVPLSANLTWLKGTEQRLPLSFVRAVVRSDFIVNHTKAAKILSQYKIPGSDISWSMEQIAQKGKSGESPKFLTELAQGWIESNLEEVNKWLEGIR